MTPERLEEIAGAINVGNRPGNYASVAVAGDEMIEIMELALDGMASRMMEVDEDMNRNRDWAANFNQGNGRTAHDYGHMGKILPMERESDQREGSGLAAMVFSGTIVLLMVCALTWWPLW